MVSLGDHVILEVAGGVHLSGTVVGLRSAGRRVTMRLDSNPRVLYDVGASALDAAGAGA